MVFPSRLFDEAAAGAAPIGDQAEAEAEEVVAEPAVVAEDGAEATLAAEDGAEATVAVVPAEAEENEPGLTFLTADVMGYVTAYPDAFLPLDDGEVWVSQADWDAMPEAPINNFKLFCAVSVIFILLPKKTMVSFSKIF